MKSDVPLKLPPQPSLAGAPTGLTVLGCGSGVRTGGLVVVWSETRGGDLPNQRLANTVGASLTNIPVDSHQHPDQANQRSNVLGRDESQQLDDRNVDLHYCRRCVPTLGNCVGQRHEPCRVLWRSSQHTGLRSRALHRAAESLIRTWLAQHVRLVRVLGVSFLVGSLLLRAVDDYPTRS